MKVLFLAVSLCLLFYGHSPAGPAGGEGAGAGVVMSVRRDALFYGGSEEAHFAVNLENPGEKTVEGMDMIFKLYRQCRSRDELAEVREGKSRTIINSFYVRRGMRLEPGKLEEKFHLDLPSLGLTEGAWPFRVEMLKDGVKVAEARGFLFISRLQSGPPLMLMPLWNIHYPPLRDARGGELDGSLAAACSLSPEDRGFLPSLLRVMETHHGVRTAVALSGQTGSDLEAMAGQKEGEGVGGAAQVLGSLRVLASSGRAEVLSSTYGYADPAQLEEMGWRKDLAEQVLRGGNSLAVLLEDRAPRGFLPPLYSMHPELPALLDEAGISYTLITETYVSAARDGKRALAEARAGYPLLLRAGEMGEIRGMMVDSRTFHLLETWDAERDPEGLVVADDILAETLLFQRESPAERRLCLLAFPDSFRPRAEVLDRIYGAIELAPWVEASLPREALSRVPPRYTSALEPGRVLEDPPPYLTALRETRERLLTLLGALQDGDALGDSLYTGLMAGEGADLYEGYPEGAGGRYLDSLRNWVEDELTGIRVKDQGTLTLSGTQGELTVVVSNVNPYPVRARLTLSGRGVDFPQGDSREVTIEPRENSFSFPLTTRGKGGFLVDIDLYLGDMRVSGTTVNLRTSNINTLAIILLTVVLALIALNLATRKMSHWGKRGRHERA